jgi:hypothetical protein
MKLMNVPTKFTPKCAKTHVARLFFHLNRQIHPKTNPPISFTCGVQGCIKAKMMDESVTPTNAVTKVLPKMFIKALRYIPRYTNSSNMGTMARFCNNELRLGTTKTRFNLNTQDKT